jgi:hypothetical protein
VVVPTRRLACVRQANWTREDPGGGYAQTGCATARRFGRRTVRICVARTRVGWYPYRDGFRAGEPTRIAPSLDIFGCPHIALGATRHACGTYDYRTHGYKHIRGQ